MTIETLPIGELLDSFELHLRARNRSPKTIHSYRLTVDQLIEFTGQKPPDQITKADIEGFIAHFLNTRSATARQRYASLQQFFKWTTEEGGDHREPDGEDQTTTRRRTARPHTHRRPATRSIAACKGKTFEGVRDEAIIRLFADTGIRLGEMAGLQTGSIDLSLGVAIVLGKGKKFRTVPYGNKTAAALDRYRRQRIRHHNSDPPAWRLGTKGALGESGIGQMLKRRGAEAGLPSIHRHMFRHTFAHQWLAAGGNKGDLQRIAGWATPQMLQRYGRSDADQRARGGLQAQPPVGRPVSDEILRYEFRCGASVGRGRECGAARQSLGGDGRPISSGSVTSSATTTTGIPAPRHRFRCPPVLDQLLQRELNTGTTRHRGSAARFRMEEVGDLRHSDLRAGLSRSTAH